jgi:hypothetical protein
VNPHLREIADCLDEALRLQSRVMDLTEQVYEAAGMSPGDPIAWPKTRPEAAASAAKPRCGASRWPRLDRDLLKAISRREGKPNFSSGSLTVDGVLSTVPTRKPMQDAICRRRSSVKWSIRTGSTCSMATA